MSAMQMQPSRQPAVTGQREDVRILYLREPHGKILARVIMLLSFAVYLIHPAHPVDVYKQETDINSFPRHCNYAMDDMLQILKGKAKFDQIDMLAFQCNGTDIAIKFEKHTIKEFKTIMNDGTCIFKKRGDKSHELTSNFTLGPIAVAGSVSVSSKTLSTSITMEQVVVTLKLILTPGEQVSPVVQVSPQSALEIKSPESSAFQSSLDKVKESLLEQIKASISDHFGKQVANVIKENYPKGAGPK